MINFSLNLCFDLILFHSVLFSTIKCSALNRNNSRPLLHSAPEQRPQREQICSAPSPREPGFFCFSINFSYLKAIFSSFFGTTGTATSAAPSSFLFNNPTTQTSSGFFGTQTQSQTQQQPQAQLPFNPDELIKCSLALQQPQLYGDERDRSVAKLNQLLAFCGVGKGWFSAQAPAVNFNAENPFCRFKVKSF